MHLKLNSLFSVFFVQFVCFCSWYCCSIVFGGSVVTGADWAGAELTTTLSIIIFGVGGGGGGGGLLLQTLGCAYFKCF